MTPQLEALAMLNNMFESYDGRPVEQAILTRRDYAALVQALTARTTYASPSEAVERDAARYRWLRDQWLGHLLKLFDTTDTSDVGLDYAIDAALSRSEEKP